MQPGTGSAGRRGPSRRAVASVCCFSRTREQDSVFLWPFSVHGNVLLLGRYANHDAHMWLLKTYAYTYIHMHTHTLTGPPTHIQAHTRTHKHTCKHAHPQTHTHMHTHTHRSARMHTHANAHESTRTLTGAYM